jgi:hypothetical protein
MRGYLLSLAASSLALIGLAGTPSPAKADHEHHRPSGWQTHHDWDRGWHRDRWEHRGYYAPYSTNYYAPSPVYVAPYYPPAYYGYVYPSYGLGYQGPNVSFWIGP